MKSWMQLNTVISLVFFIAFNRIDGQKVIKPPCGRRMNDDNIPVTSGVHTVNWPWHALILNVDVSNEPSINYRCSGTLINSDSILTAAHCISHYSKPIDNTNISVSLGRQNLDIDESSGQSFEVAEINLHPNFDSKHLDNDIAIIRLSTTVTFNNYVQPVCLWHSDRLELSEVIGREGTGIGWGITETGENSKALKQAFMSVIPTRRCLATDRDFFGYVLSETNFCGGFRIGTSVCNGDSWGSMTFEENGLYYIRGIYSVSPPILDVTSGQGSGEDLCDSTHYSVFTDVAQYLPWIEEVANGCKEIVMCSRTFVHLDEHFVCDVLLNMQLDEPNCKIIFAEYTNVTFLTVHAEGAEAQPDLSDAVDKFENLKAFQFSNTKLTIVERRKIAPFRKIEELFLTTNAITEIAADTFDDLKDLTILEVHHNQLKAVDRDLFTELRKLKEVDFDNNQLEDLPAGLFRNNDKLEQISMANNKIKVIHRDLFSELQSVTLLDFGFNQIEILPEDLFLNNKKLANIHFTNNKVKVIHRDLFMELRDLIVVNLGNNQLELLPEGLFRNNKKLNNISFANNKIKTIECDFQNLLSLTRLDFVGNVCIDELCNVTTFCNTTSLTHMQKKLWKKC